MGSLKTKIKYKEEGAYGILEEHYLYCCDNSTVDITSIYDYDGSLLFCFNNTMDGNLFDKIKEIVEKWDPNINPNVEYMDEEDRKKCGLR